MDVEHPSISGLREAGFRRILAPHSCEELLDMRAEVGRQRDAASDDALHFQAAAEIFGWIDDELADRYPDAFAAWAFDSRFDLTDHYRRARSRELLAGAEGQR